jgi:hypothetical protein
MLQNKMNGIFVFLFVEEGNVLVVILRFFHFRDGK